MKSPGRIAYEAWNGYNERNTGRSASWYDVHVVDRQMWERIAHAVLNEYGNKHVGYSDDPPPFWKPDYHGLPTE